MGRNQLWVVSQWLLWDCACRLFLSLDYTRPVKIPALIAICASRSSISRTKNILLRIFSFILFFFCLLFLSASRARATWILFLFFSSVHDAFNPRCDYFHGNSSGAKSLLDKKNLFVEYSEYFRKSGLLYPSINSQVVNSKLARTRFFTPPQFRNIAASVRRIASAINDEPRIYGRRRWHGNETYILREGFKVWYFGWEALNIGLPTAIPPREDCGRASVSA